MMLYSRKESMSKITTRFTIDQIILIINALSYQQWNDRELTSEDIEEINGIFENLEKIVSVES